MKVEESFQANQLLYCAIAKYEWKNRTEDCDAVHVYSYMMLLWPLHRCKSAAEMEQTDEIYSISR